MTSTEAFARAREVLLRNRDDLERARAEFRWPDLEEFNWACDWFDVLAAGDERAALTIVSERRRRAARDVPELAERSTAPRALASWTGASRAAIACCVMLAQRAAAVGDDARGDAARRRRDPGDDRS